MPLKSRRDDGYSRFSILVHWITAILIVLLFVTHEADRGSAVYFVHVSFGAAAGIFLLWRVWYRARRGMTAKSSQSFVLNLASQLVIWGFLACIVVVILTGYLLPWSLGQPLDFMGVLAIPSPIPSHDGFHDVLEEVHEISGQLFVPLLALHILGAAKHAFIDKDGITQRMFKSKPNGC